MTYTYSMDVPRYYNGWPLDSDHAAEADQILVTYRRDHPVTVGDLVEDDFEFARELPERVIARLRDSSQSLPDVLFTLYISSEDSWHRIHAPDILRAYVMNGTVVHTRGRLVFEEIVEKPNDEGASSV